ncbi:MAG: hypothetical protein WCG02_01120 [Candidatus Taylorbacteria bacterium]
MTSKKPIRVRGFVAMIATILLVTGVMAFALVTLTSAMTYSDLTYRRERRMQTTYNLEACLDTVQLMIARDFYMSGATFLSEFGCNVYVNNDFSGHVTVDATSSISDISRSGHR